MRYFYLIFSFLLTCNSLLAQDEISDSVILTKQYINVSDSAIYKITTNDLRIEGIDTVQNESIQYKVKAKVLDLYKDQYTIHWHIFDIDNSNKNKITKNPLSFLSDLDIYFSVDVDGKFIDFQNSQTTLLQFYKALEDTEDSNADKTSILKILAEVEKLYNTSDAVNSIFVKDIKQFHHFFGYGEFQLNHPPKKYQTYIDNLFNSNSTPAEISFSLKEISPYLNNYVMTSSAIANEEWLRESWFSYLTKTAKELKMETPDRETIDSNIIYTIDTLSRIKDTGWLSYSVQTKRVNFQNTNFSQKRVIELIP